MAQAGNNSSKLIIKTFAKKQIRILNIKILILAEIFENESILYIIQLFLGRNFIAL